MNIILDAMSGDHAPLEILRGAVTAKEEFPEINITLVGDPEVIRSVAASEKLDISSMEIRSSSSVIAMEDAPLSVIHDKKDSSMGVGLKMLSQDEGDAFVSAGNTGALLTGSALIVRRLKGIARPAIGAILPLSNPVLLIDSGANITVTEENLETMVENKVIGQTLDGILKSKLSKREYVIMCLRFGLNGEPMLTQQEVADKLGISRSYISRLEKKSLETLKKYVKPSDFR